MRKNWKEKVSVSGLEEALICLGDLSKKTLVLLLWIDNNPDCTPIIQRLELKFPKLEFPKSRLIARAILNGINSKIWILGIIVDKKLYNLIYPQEFALRTCEVNL